MQLSINNTIVTIPKSQQEFTLGQRILFHLQFGHQLSERRDQIQKEKDEDLKQILLVDLEYDTMFSAFSFFTGFSVEALKASEFVDVIAGIYHKAIVPLFDDNPENFTAQDSFEWSGDSWGLDSPELKRGGSMRFGQFIDAKQLIKDLSDIKASKWEQVLPLSVIYLRKKGEQYEESFLYEDSERLKLMESLPMTTAAQVGFFFEQHNDFLNRHFDIFKRSRAKKSGKHVAAHYDRYGWVNFLKAIAATKVFDIPGSGMNSIQCAREASLFDVLVFASEDKSLNEAMALDQENEMRKIKSQSRVKK